MKQITPPLLVVKFLLLLMLPHSKAEYEAAGCSDEGCGIPCYMRPVEDPCHYQKNSQCNDDGSTDLEQWIRNLNSSLHRLGNKLIQKGIIPAGDTCRPLASIEYGGVIYSDLLLSPGVIANYVCQDGYSLFGYPNRTCATDGSWIGGDEEDPVCQYSSAECAPLFNIPYGHVHFSSTDTTKILPGDIVTYSCDPPYSLEGAEYRICMKNGSWSEEQPQCIIEPSSGPEQNSSYKLQGKDDKLVVILGTVAGVCLGVILLFLIGLFAFVVTRKYFHSKKGYKEVSSRSSGNTADEQSSNADMVSKVVSFSSNKDDVSSTKLEQKHIEIIKSE